MKTVWKYPLDTRIQVIDVPLGAVALCVKEQAQQRVIYFEVESTNSTKPRTVFLFHTGEEQVSRDFNLEYVGTLLFGSGGHYVEHCYVTE